VADVTLKSIRPSGASTGQIAAAITAHTEAPDPHPQYQTEADADLWLASKSFQSLLQFENDGEVLGAAGTVDELNFSGAGLSAVRVGNKVTVTSTGAASNVISGYIADAGGIGGHRVVRSIGSGAVGYADYSVAGHGDDTIGISTGAADAGYTVQVQQFGYLTHVGWSWTPGQPIFVGTNGALTQTAPTSGFVQVVGHASDTDEMYVSIEQAIFF